MRVREQVFGYLKTQELSKSTYLFQNQLVPSKEQVLHVESSFKKWHKGQHILDGFEYEVITNKMASRSYKHQHKFLTSVVIMVHPTPNKRQTLLSPEKELKNHDLYSAVPCGSSLIARKIVEDHLKILAKTLPIFLLRIPVNVH